MPSFQRILDVYESGMDAHVRSGRIPRRDVLKPARVIEQAERVIIYRDGSDPLVFYDDGTWVPYGQKISIPGVRSRETLLNDTRFIEMMADGYYPVGENIRNVLQNKHTAAEHDLWHFVASLKFPEVMAEVSRMCRHIVAHKDIYYDENNILKVDVRDRVFMSLEALVVIPPENRDRMMQVLSLPRRPEGHHFQVGEVKDHLVKLVGDES